MPKPHARYSKDSFPPTFNTVRRHVIATNLLAAYMRVSCARHMRMRAVRLGIISQPHTRPPGCSRVPKLNQEDARPRARPRSKNAIAEDSGGRRQLDTHQAGHRHCGRTGRRGRNSVFVAITFQDLVGTIFEPELGRRGRQHRHAQDVDRKNVLRADPIEQVWLRKRGHCGAAHVGANVGFARRARQRVAYIPYNVAGRTPGCDRGGGRAAL